jgi:predicted dehydrogenase
MLKVGLIGVGRKALTIDDETRWLLNYDYLPCSQASAFEAYESTKVVALANPGDDAKSSFENRFGAVNHYDSAQVMLENEKLDIIGIATHAHLHAEMTVLAAQAGVKGVLCEKAMATSLAECDAMIEACEKSNAKLLVNHPRRFHPVFQMAKELIAEGAIGEIKMLECFGYGKLMHNGSHAFDVLTDFFGPAQWVQGELIETDDKADPDGRGFVKMQNGVTALVDFASIQPFTFTFRGDSGSLTIDQFEEGLEVTLYELQDQRPGRPWFSYSPKRAVKRRYHAPQSFLLPMQGAVDELVKSIEENRAPNCDGKAGRASIEMGIALHASAENNGTRIALPFEDKNKRVVSR